MDLASFIPRFPRVPADPGDRARLAAEINTRAAVLGPDSPVAACLSTFAANLLDPYEIPAEDAARIRDAVEAAGRLPAPPMPAELALQLSWDAVVASAAFATSEHFAGLAA